MNELSTNFSKLILYAAFLFLFQACSLDNPLNSPYPKEESRENIYYSSFSERPKHLDPARSYSSNEYSFIGQIYEPPFQYHYLKRPYELIPLSAVSVPKPVYLDDKGNILPDSPDEKVVSKAVYEIKIKPGIMFQNHPAFTKNSDNTYAYHNLKEEEISSIHELRDFAAPSTRELKASDYIYQIKRLANPQNNSPLFPVLASYIEGFSEFSEEVKKRVEEIRKKRKSEAGSGYNQESDEQNNPIFINLNDLTLSGLKEVDPYTYTITLKKKYPQFIYWMAMPFFAPMPWEAEAFYLQGTLIKRQITLNWYPVGTGPFRLEINNPNKEMVLVQNENFHGETYPHEGFPEARALSLLQDAGKPIPFIKKAIYKLETEDIPYWNKFLQGYYDASGITSDSFDMAIKLSMDGDALLTDSIREKDIHLSTAVQASTFYIGFNMLDDVIGGYSEKKNLLRQAISIAVDYEEYIQIFLNGRGISAHSPLPPGIFGYQEGERGINHYVYDWIEGKAVRKTISEAKRLLAEAGYPGGKDQKTGVPLLLYFDTPSSGPDSKSLFDWLRKEFKKIDIQLVVRATSYNRFQDKMVKGDAQIFQWGWNADYPDPENFLFLLYGPNKKAEKGGENAANYENPAFDRLFSTMANMENSEKRLLIIGDMLDISGKNAPWLWGFHPKSFSLHHGWLKNGYPNLMANNTLKYLRVNGEARIKYQNKWNKPVIWPVIWISLLVVAVLIFAVTISNKKNNVTT